MGNERSTKRAELAAGGLEAFEDDEQVFERARQTIELPHDERIAGAELIEQAVQLGPIPPSARRGLLEYFLAAGLSERADLRRGVLILGFGDAGVAEQHDGCFSCCQTGSLGNSIRQNANP